MRLVLVILWILSGASLALQGFQEQHPLTGRRIAPVMGSGGSDWLDRSSRESEEHAEAALDALQLTAGMTVADVGAGTGYFTLRIARRVGPSGKVWADDIQPEMLTILRQHASDAHFTNIETVLGAESSAKLPAGQMDLILLVDVYHEFSQPQKMLRSLREALKPAGRLVLLEYRKEDPAIPIRPEHKMTVEEVKTEVEAEGFHMQRVIETLPRQHICIFIKTQE